MPASEDLLVGKLALKLGFVTQEQVDACVRRQAALSPAPPLGELLIREGHINREQLDRILAEQKKNLAAMDPAQKKRREDAIFGKLVVKKDLAGQEQVNECLRIQAGPEGRDRGLGEIMVDRGYLSREQVKEILATQLKKIMRCRACAMSFTVVSSSGGKNARCPRCKQPLVEATPNDTVRTIGEFSTMTIRAITDEIPHSGATKIRIRCVICDEGFSGLIDSTGRIRCPACQTSFTPRS